MVTYKTFRWRIHENTASDIDTVLNTLPAETMVEGYVCSGNEIYVTVSHYDRYKKEIDREVVKMSK